MRKVKDTFIPHKGNNHTPHLLTKQVLSIAVALVILVELVAVASPILQTKVDIFDIAAVFPAVVTALTNDVRKDAGLSTLTSNELLTAAAQAKANDMAAKGYFAHESPDGTQPWGWMDKVGYKYAYAGENLAVNFSDSREVVSAWQNSPTHNLNLLGPRYQEIGVAVAEGVYKGREAVFVVQMFASPRVVPSQAQPPVEPAPVAAAPTTQGEESDVLGAETQGASVEEASPTASTEEAVAPEQVLPTQEVSEEQVSVVSRVVGSPHTYSTYLYALVALLFIALLMLGFVPGRAKHHPRAALRGLGFVAVVLTFMLANNLVLFTPVDLPVDNSNAALVVSAL